MKNDVKIIALDLDGTLLDSAKRLSARNRAALEKAAARGALIVPTTGRFFNGIPEEVRTLPCVRYAITINGAQVIDGRTGAALVREEIPLDTALAIMRLLDGHDVIYDCYQDNAAWMTAALKDKCAAYAPDEHYLRMIREWRQPVDDLKATLAARGRAVQKIMLFARDLAVRAAIADALAAGFPQVAVSSSTFNNLEINIRTAHKGVALERFAAHMGCGLENCMAFGDGLNDLTMIQAAGVGVAMANACPEVRTAADHITLSNDADGVAAALARFALV